ncbi:MAG: hypothetical protein Q9219_001627 [cf. Caloplaca sp. 3 TL-2023]
MEPGAAVAAYGVETAAEGAVGAAMAIAKPTMPLKAAWQRLVLPDPLPRSSHSLSIIKGKAYIFGGADQPRHLVSNAMHVLTLPSSTVKDIDYKKLPVQSSAADSEVPAARVGHSAAVVSDRIYVFGGQGEESMEALAENGTVWGYDTKLDYWTRLNPAKGSPSPPARWNHSSAVSVHPLPSHQDHTEPAYGEVDPEAHGTLFIHGGCTASGRLKDVWGFDIAARAWSPFPDTPGEAREGSSLTFAQNRLYRFGGFDGKTQLGRQMDYLNMTTTTFHDQGGRGELAVTSATGQWEATTLKPGSPMPGNRSVAGLHALTTGQGRNYLILFLGQKAASSSAPESAGENWGDVWSFQLRPEGMTAASFKDATRELVGAKTGENTWSPVDIPESTMTTGKKEAPGQLRLFASAPGHDLDPGSIVIWGGVRSDASISGEGWILTIE